MAEAIQTAENLLQNGSFEDTETTGRGRRRNTEVVGWQVSGGPGPGVKGDPWRPAADARITSNRTAAEVLIGKLSPMSSRAREI